MRVKIKFIGGPAHGNCYEYSDMESVPDTIRVPHCLPSYTPLNGSKLPTQPTYGKVDIYKLERFRFNGGRPFYYFVFVDLLKDREELHKMIFDNFIGTK